METDRSLVYSKPFFELQLIFAQKIASLLQRPLEHTVLYCTAFYRIFGLDWSLDPMNPAWQSYSAGLQREPDQVEYTYRRLFPPAFAQSVHKDETRYSGIWGRLVGRDTWGQFLRRNWQVHQKTMALFLQRVEQLERVEDYLQCFPYQTLKTEAPIKDFYAFYKVHDVQ